MMIGLVNLKKHLKRVEEEAKARSKTEGGCVAACCSSFHFLIQKNKTKKAVIAHQKKQIY